jgi:arginyl-tRNA synthetase
MRQLHEKGLSHDPARGQAQMALLVEPHEEVLLVALSRYSEVVEAAALNHEPHQLAHYLRDLANAFHTLLQRTSGSGERRRAARCSAQSESWPRGK